MLQQMQSMTGAGSSATMVQVGALAARAHDAVAAAPIATPPVPPAPPAGSPLTAADVAAIVAKALADARLAGSLGPAPGPVSGLSMASPGVPPVPGAAGTPPMLMPPPPAPLLGVSSRPGVSRQVEIADLKLQLSQALERVGKDGGAAGGGGDGDGSAQEAPVDHPILRRMRSSMIDTSVIADEEGL